jgi:hypothetical protein
MKGDSFKSRSKRVYGGHKPTAGQSSKGKYYWRPKYCIWSNFIR